MIGWSPTHEPVVDASVVPTVAAPVIVGGELLAGMPLAVVIAAVGLDVAVPSPELFAAVTANRIVAPRTAVVSVYLVPVAPAIGVQLAPLASQRCQA